MKIIKYYQSNYRMSNTSPPTPKFHKGQAVRYNAKKRAEMFAYIREHPGARMPTVNLRIWAEPRWSSNNNTWVYEYEYDWTSEGTAYECDLELAEPLTRSTPF